MAYFDSFSSVSETLHGLRARLVKRTSRGDLYVTPSNKWVLVARSGGGYEVRVHNSRAECGCD